MLETTGGGLQQGCARPVDGIGRAVAETAAVAETITVHFAVVTILDPADFTVTFAR